MKRLVVAACARKEMLLLWRDPQTLLLLFLMPAVFILVMSLALQERFEQGGGTVATVLVVDDDDSDSADTVVESLRRNEGFEVVELGGAVDDDVLHQRIRARDAGFGLRIDAGFEEAVYADEGEPTSRIHIRVAPKIDRQREALLLAAVRQGLGQARMEALSDRLAPLVEFDAGGIGGDIDVAYLYGGDHGSTAPSSVQQNVPAWLVFGIFFVVIPLSNTMIRERQSGTEQRLRTTPAGAGSILAGKLLPYFALNQLQAVAMLLVGLLLVPALGGAALGIAGVPVATLVLMAVAVSVAALGYALLVSALSSTTEQAAMLGGGGNIILAAIGGIMVPEFVMPPALQAMTRLSPMAWGLDGFLLAFLERAGPADVMGYAGALIAFGAVGVALAGWRQSRRSE